MGMFSAIKWVSMLVLGTLFLGGIYYASSLKAELAISEQNNKVLADSIESQQAVIDAKLAEIKEIQMVNATLTEQNRTLQKDIDDLNNRFSVSANGTSRDFGDITRAKPGVVNKIIDRATDNVNRCFEIATGAELQEGEKNNECQELINSITK